MAKKLKEDYTSRDWYEYYDALRQKNYRTYQETGETRYDRANLQYEKIADAFLAKMQAESERDTEIKKRMNNCNYVCERLHDEPYTKGEVEKLLKDAVWW